MSKRKDEEVVIVWDASKPDEMQALVMAGVQVRIPITQQSTPGGVKPEQQE